MDPFPPIGTSLTIGIGLALLILSATRPANVRGLVITAAASFAVVFTSGYAITARHLPADPAWIQREFQNLSPERQALMKRYFEMRAEAGISKPVSRSEFRSLLTQIESVPNPPNAGPLPGSDNPAQAVLPPSVAT